jgi:PAS domain S-box-containing protein
MKSSHKIVGLLASVALLVAMGVTLLFSAFGQIGESAEARKLSLVLINHADDFVSALKDAETGERGFALTGDEAFLEPYLAVRGRVGDQLRELRQLAPAGEAQKHLEAVAPLMEAKLAALAHVIELRRNKDVPAVIAVVEAGEGKRLMDSIRAEMKGFIEIETGALSENEAVFQSKMRQLLGTIVAASVFALLFSLVFAFMIYRETQHRLTNVVERETQQLLSAQVELNGRLEKANVTLQVSEERLAVTLHSIGDGMIATDAAGNLTLINSVAEKLTGWTQKEAAGRPVDEIFHIINQETRAPSTIPVMETLAKGTVHGLSNHTILIARDGSECSIADTCAPIRDRGGVVVGAVLVFRDVTEEYAAERAARDSAALIHTIMNTVVDGVITLKASEGTIETVNPGAERMFGYTY